MFPVILIVCIFVLFTVGGKLHENEKDRVLSSLSSNMSNLDVKFLLYDHIDSPEILINRTNIRQLDFDSNKQTVFLIHGWSGIIGSPMCPMVKDAYLETRDINVIIVDWNEISLNGYELSKISVMRVGRALGKFIKQMVDRIGLNLNKTALVGFSLGAHVAAIASRRVGRKIDHITGLDPAGPLFNEPNNKYRLRKGDAKFVQVIHTCSIYGFSYDIGDADYWPNGGYCNQPGCVRDITGVCSHSRSYEFYIESLKSGKFSATKCTNYLVYSSGICQENESSAMGNHAISRKRGNFFLTTNDSPPFAKG